MSKELAYTKNPDMSHDKDKGMYIYYLNMSHTESEDEADGNCELFSQAPAMYELLKEFIGLWDIAKAFDIPVLIKRTQGLIKKAKQILKKIES